MEFKIERAKMKHLKDIQNLNKLLFNREKNYFDKTLDINWPLSKSGTQYFKCAISKRNYCALIALINNKIIGYLVGKIVDESTTWRAIGKQAEINNMLVLSKYRNKKIGSSLLKAFFCWAKKQGVKNIKVVASASNQKTISFYRKHGFKDYDLTLEVDL